MDGKEADNWIIWGLIMRKAGQYESAMHKFKHALSLDPEGTAKTEIFMTERIMQLDK